jgi:hypothetical protein
LGNEWGNSWFLIGNAVNSYLKKEFNIKTDYLKKIVILSHISASVCWESITCPRLLMGLESVWGRRYIP